MVSVVLVYFMRRLLFEPQSSDILTLMTILKTLYFIIAPANDGKNSYMAAIKVL